MVASVLPLTFLPSKASTGQHRQPKQSFIQNWLQCMFPSTNTFPQATVWLLQPHPNACTHYPHHQCNISYELRSNIDIINDTTNKLNGAGEFAFFCGFCNAGPNRVHRRCGPHQRLVLHMQGAYVSHDVECACMQVQCVGHGIMRNVPSYSPTVHREPGGKRSGPSPLMQLTSTPCLRFLEFSV